MRFQRLGTNRGSGSSTRDQKRKVEEKRYQNKTPAKRPDKTKKRRGGMSVPRTSRKETISGAKNSSWGMEGERPHRVGCRKRLTTNSWCMIRGSKQNERQPENRVQEGRNWVLWVKKRKKRSCKPEAQPKTTVG